MTDAHSPPPNPAYGAQDPGAHELPHDMLFPALRSDPESFPVLKAFQEYIEAERERARKRLVTVSVIAIASLVLVVGGFLAVGAVVIGNLARRNDLLQDVVMRAAVREGSVAAPLHQPQPDGPSSGEMARLTEALARVQRENVAMQDRVKALQDLPSTVAASIGAAMSNFTANARPPLPQDPVQRPTLASAPSYAPPTSPSVSPSPPTPPVPATASTPTHGSPGDRVTLSAPRTSTAAPRLQGFAPANLTLVTDRGISIPWRIVVPE